MKTKNAVLMKMALETLSGKWGLAVGTYLVYSLIMGVFQINYREAPEMIAPILMSVSFSLALIIGGPMALGLATFSLALSRNQNAKFEQLFSGFKNFGVSLGAYLLMALFVFLWALLLIIPGIIAAISYSITFYIMADDRSIGAMAAIDKSKEMMAGYKWKYFCLYCRFIGWFFLCILTLGIGFLWLVPYIQVSLAKFYDDVKENAMVIEEIPAQPEIG